MKMPLNSDAQAFRDDLREKAAKKRKAALQKRKAIVKRGENPGATDTALLAVRDALQALSDLLVSKENAKAGPVEFEVTERDGFGVVKKFKVNS